METDWTHTVLDVELAFRVNPSDKLRIDGAVDDRLLGEDISP